MGQTLLLPDCNATDRWQPVVPSFRLRPLTRNARWNPLPGQLILPGMGLADDGGEVLLPTGEDDAALRGEADNAVSSPQPTCPNCGGTEFDEDGDCTSCWEPGVVKPAGGRESYDV